MRRREYITEYPCYSTKATPPKRGATPNIDRNPKPKVTGTTKSERARSLFEQGYTVLEVGRLLPDVGWSYAWDIHRAWQTTKARDTSKATKAPASRKSGMPRDAKSGAK